MKILIAIPLSLGLLLTACRPVPQAISTPDEGTDQPATVSVSTSVPVTSLPGDTTPQPSSTVPLATPIPTQPSIASPTKLKYQLLAEYSNFFYCDPDQYPVARGDEAELAQERFADLQTNQEEFQAIIDQNGMNNFTSFSAEQKLSIYREHKKLAAIQFVPAEDKYQFQLQIADEDMQGFIIQGTIDGNGVITEEQREPSVATCPICLVAETQIDTPRGLVAIENLRVEDEVWTIDETGQRNPAIILKTSQITVPIDHQLVYITLEDGRELWASPGHPTSEGKSLGALQVGDRLDNGKITHLEFQSSERPVTYDILPAGGTGFYWANGILLASSLQN